MVVINQWSWSVVATFHLHERGQRSLTELQASNNYVPSSTLAFFSEDKIKSLSNQLKHDRLHDLIYQIDGIAAARFKAFRNISASSLLSVHVTDDDLISAPKYIQGKTKDSMA